MKAAEISVTSVPLAELRRGESAVVTGLAASRVLEEHSEDAAALLSRLRDLGFVAGARCEILARMWLGGDPLVIRIGGSTFALRRAEAATVRVLRVQEQPTHGAALGSDTSAATG